MRDLLLDVDGPAADFVAAILDAIQADFTPADVKGWDVLEMLDQDQKELALSILEEPEFWLEMPVVDGAKEGVRYLELAGYDISWVTSPWASCFGWESARRAWLEKHFNMSENGHHYIPTSSKHKVDGDVFIDDKEENVEKWMLTHPSKRVFLFDAPHNQDSSLPRISWTTLRSYL